MNGQFPRRGEIWLGQFPSDPKIRPALIVSIDNRNQFSNNVLAVPLTTNLRPADTHILIPRGHCGLSSNSMARYENLSYTLRIFLRRGHFSGAISAKLMRQIELAIMLAVGISAD